MSEEEFKNIKSTGVIKSRGDYNLEGQEGLTYYSRDPGQAAHYAHGFAPAQFKASGRHNVYVVAVKDPNTEVKVAGTGEDEVGIPHAISAEDILHVHVGKAYASYPGSHSINKDSWNKEPHEGKYSEGSSSAPSTMIGYKKKNLEERQRQIDERKKQIQEAKDKLQKEREEKLKQRQNNNPNEN
jgi:hypothetical protein